MSFADIVLTRRVVQEEEQWLIEARESHWIEFVNGGAGQQTTGDGSAVLGCDVLQKTNLIPAQWYQVQLFFISVFI